MGSGFWSRRAVITQAVYSLRRAPPTWQAVRLRAELCVAHDAHLRSGGVGWSSGAAGPSVFSVRSSARGRVLQAADIFLLSSWGK